MEKVPPTGEKINNYLTIYIGNNLIKNRYNRKQF